MVEIEVVATALAVAVAEGGGGGGGLGQRVPADHVQSAGVDVHRRHHGTHVWPRPQESQPVSGVLDVKWVGEGRGRGRGEAEGSVGLGV